MRPAPSTAPTAPTAKVHMPPVETIAAGEAAPAEEAAALSISYSITPVELIRRTCWQQPMSRCSPRSRLPH